MPLDEGSQISPTDLFQHFLIGVIALIITALAWFTTNVREDRLANATVLIIENNRRRISTNRGQTYSSTGINTEQPATVQEADQLQNATNTVDTPETSNTDPLRNSVDDITQGIINDASESSVDFETEEELLDDFGPREIIEEMDRDFPDTTEGLRHRHNLSQATNSNESIDSNLNISEPIANAKLEEDNADFKDVETENAAFAQIRIKLKYLNDDLKLVSGSLDEFIGDFKQRHFTEELAAQKLVRLVFNGHVLQPDSKTLAACGLFDNCVVHCLIHNKKNTSTAQQSVDPSNNLQNETGNILITTQLGVTREPSSPENTNQYFYIYMGICFVALTLGFCWFCRIQYSYLFTLYSTIGLVLITTIFLTMIPLLILIER